MVNNTQPHLINVILCDTGHPWVIRVWTSSFLSVLAIQISLKFFVELILQTLASSCRIWFRRQEELIFFLKPSHQMLSQTWLNIRTTWENADGLIPWYSGLTSLIWRKGRVEFRKYSWIILKYSLCWISQLFY